jgi:SagB-type dehydrogenase family enzyme
MIKTCLEYHQATSYDRLDMSGHALDWANQPTVFKQYPGIASLALPRDLQLPKGKLSAILSEPAAAGLPKRLELEMLSLLLLLSNTHTARARSSEGDFFFRSAASAGALYPTEIYMASHEVKGIDNGLYHYAIQNHSLDPLRRGDVLGLAQGEGGYLTFFLTAIFFRSAWKYRARAYRYHLLDTGHVVDNLILALKASKLPYSVTYDFDDGEVNRLLGLDDQKEVALAIIHVPGGRGILDHYKKPIPSLPEPMLQASRVSTKETDYPVIREIHEAGMRRAESMEQRVCGEKEMIQELGVMPKTWTPLGTFGPWSEVIDYPDAVFRRRSRRNFVKKALSKQGMDTLLRSVCRRDGSPYDQSVAVGFLVGQVEGLEPGFYLLDGNKESWASVSSGQFMARSTSICLDQAWLVNAAVHFLFLANLEVLDKTWGPRGYRYAMLTAGRIGQRLYIAAEAMGMGCCGIGALYDGEAMEMLGLNQSSRLLYLVAVGNVKRA